MGAACLALLAELDARLREAEERVLRLHFPAQVKLVPLLDEEGALLEPPGQTVDIRVIEQKNDVTILHSCVFGTGAEVDYIERAAHIYQSRKGNSQTIKPHLVTLTMGTNPHYRTGYLRSHSSSCLCRGYGTESGTHERYRSVVRRL